MVPSEELFRTFNEVSKGRFEEQGDAQLNLRTFVQHLAVESFIAEHDGFLGSVGAEQFLPVQVGWGQLSQLLNMDKDEPPCFNSYYNIFQGVGRQRIGSPVRWRGAVALPAAP